MTENNQEEFYQEVASIDEVLEEAGIPTQEQFMGLVLSTESAGLDDDRMQQAFRDWERYYSSMDTNFGWVLCHLICKADLNNLHRISKGYPEHVRIFAEKNILASVDQDKIDQVMNSSEEVVDGEQ